VRCYGFAEGDDSSWRNYIATDAKHYATGAAEERAAQNAAIAKLEALTITAPGNGRIPQCVLVPVKANSQGCPGKNRVLLRSCLEKLAGCGHKVYVTGDDIELLHEVKDLAEVVPLPAIGAFDDVTKTLRKWQTETGFCGDVALAQCTSPRMRTEWVDKCLKALASAPVAATCVEIDFKPTALFREEHGVFVPISPALPAATVARQLLPRTVRFTGAVTAFHTDALMCESLFQCGVMEPVMTSEQDALDVDSPEQLKEALTLSRTKSRRTENPWATNCLHPESSSASSRRWTKSRRLSRVSKPATKPGTSTANSPR